MTTEAPSEAAGETHVRSHACRRHPKSLFSDPDSDSAARPGSEHRRGVLGSTQAALSISVCEVGKLINSNNLSFQTPISLFHPLDARREPLENRFTLATLAPQK